MGDGRAARQAGLSPSATSRRPRGQGTMELEDAMRRRRMVRAFEDLRLPPHTLERILELSTHAPSAGFSQGWSFVVLEGPEQTERYWRLTLPAERRPSFPWPH